MTDLQRRLDLDSYIPCQLAKLSNTVIRSVTSLFEEWFDISIPEWKVMAVIEKTPGMSAVDVAQHAGLDTVAVSRAVTKLMDAGRVRREFGREDRRRSILELTEAGRELFAKMTPLAASLQSSLLEGLTEEEKAVFEKTLKLLSAKSRDLADKFESKNPQAKPTERLNSRTYDIKNGGSYVSASLMARYISGTPTLR
jgi:DNA-binding MarR family transcriptional regulator